MPPADKKDAAPEAKPEDKPAPAPAPQSAEAAPAEQKPDLPKKVMFRWLYAFLDENGTERTWRGGSVVTNPTEIAMLVERKAPLQAHDEKTGTWSLMFPEQDGISVVAKGEKKEG